MESLFFFVLFFYIVIFTAKFFHVIRISLHYFLHALICHRRVTDIFQLGVMKLYLLVFSSTTPRSVKSVKHRDKIFISCLQPLENVWSPQPALVQPGIRHITQNPFVRGDPCSEWDVDVDDHDEIRASSGEIPRGLRHFENIYSVQQKSGLEIYNKKCCF